MTTKAIRSATYSGLIAFVLFCLFLIVQVPGQAVEIIFYLFFYYLIPFILLTIAGRFLIRNNTEIGTFISNRNTHLVNSVLLVVIHFIPMKSILSIDIIFHGMTAFYLWFALCASTILDKFHSD